MRTTELAPLLSTPGPFATVFVDVSQGVVEAVAPGPAARLLVATGAGIADDDTAAC
ncbi:hypothetical protein [Nocardioides sp. CER19]|uniref:hypothetical protein n=1 Tax=Nocardioides sp. CER19 TaxID=3038538 RepID=UPI00244AB98F|nr:hypothetical protein [Nocardioides sp. CER19]MDH2416261.1 hypothetical protein [Nocardioides sp. CER19]